MAARNRNDVLQGHGYPDNYASTTSNRLQDRHVGPAAPRNADERNGSKDLADFFNSTRIEHPTSASRGDASKFKPLISGNTHSETGRLGDATTMEHSMPDVLEVICGPLLNYRRTENTTWFGSVLIVTRGGGLIAGPIPELRLKGLGKTIAETVSADSGADITNNGPSEEVKIQGTRLYSDPSNTFWRFDLRVPIGQLETQWEYSFPSINFAKSEYKRIQKFFVPAISESMRIMFHSCNGFSVGTDEEAYSGPCLWNDVLRVHEKTPFHVMLGGGDQIYNDGIRVSGPLRQWTDIANPKKRKDFPFPEELRRQCDEYYVNNYVRWYGIEPFASVNGRIPQINLWDDHDIIDGFGSYVHDFMKCDVFRGIGGVAHKYYLLFQHHLPPPTSTYVTGTPHTHHLHHTKHEEGPQAPLVPQENTFFLQNDPIEPCYIMGPKPGPYVAERSRSIYAKLGARIAFFGIDARTERTRHQVNYPETYEIIFEKLRSELRAAASSPTPVQHLIVLLGIPIAYPRLTWLENIFSSPLMGPLKFLNKRFGFGGGFFNDFDGNVDLLDDLDDHYTARTHKAERLFLVHQLQALALEFSVRITILGGDVHLAAVGRFYSNPKLQIPVVTDHRYMANIISSAIVNKPPPQAVANLLARRNKIHHLDHHTDETLMKYFDKDPGQSPKTANFNKVTMPSRNWAMITENNNKSDELLNGTNGTNTDTANGSSLGPEPSAKSVDGHQWLHDGEVDAGTQHKSADPEKHGRGSDGSLDVAIRVEKDQHDGEGRTQAYGMTIPRLVYNAELAKLHRTRDILREAVHEHNPLHHDK